VRSKLDAGDFLQGHVPGKPLFRGTGDTDCLCGDCSSVIAAKMEPTQCVIVDSAICVTCGAENGFPPHLRA
jgi:hypothetical protein